MSKRRHSPDSSRRNFLKGAGLVGAASVAAPVGAKAQGTAPRADLKALPPGPRQIAVETKPPEKDPVNQSTSGGDFMVDVFKTLDIDYLAMNCASSFRGLHEAIINYNNNKPEILTCPHEEIAVSMAQGYAKIEGKPMAMICHGVVGLQHATMAIYNAWRARRARKAAGWCGESGDRLRPARAHAGRPGAAHRACRDLAMRGDRQCRPDEFPRAASAQHELPPRSRPVPCRRDPGARNERSL